ncbi:hypothetical protein E2C01_095330 [Portunus trituberculatus]|uniref:Uncharacterized protein n=1 Tax=Portunus trituberculatus TaxID=210409 RepID=A0A5B7JZW9_PORTR|nr:hypothetical protein [Portunus trituberculatus]
MTTNLVVVGSPCDKLDSTGDGRSARLAFVRVDLAVCEVDRTVTIGDPSHGHEGVQPQLRGVLIMS